MNILNLTPGFAPCGTDTTLAFDAFVFNGGEPHIKLHDALAHSTVQITTRLNNFADVGLLLVATDALRRAGADRIRVFAPYFPGARQDRVMVPGEPLTVKVYADLINAQYYDRITIFDPHSDVTPALLNNVQVLSNEQFAQQSVAHLTDFWLVAPDGGALKKIYKIAEYLGGVPVLECGKRRDVKTGRLSGFRVPEPDLGGRPCVIVDDICDGGGTFVGLADELQKHGAGPLYLVVSHGIFSRGFAELSQRFTQIFTTDSMASSHEEQPDNLQIIPLTLP